MERLKPLSAETVAKYRGAPQQAQAPEDREHHAKNRSCAVQQQRQQSLLPIIFPVILPILISRFPIIFPVILPILISRFSVTYEKYPSSQTGGDKRA